MRDRQYKLTEYISMLLKDGIEGSRISLTAAFLEDVNEIEKKAKKNREKK